MKIIILTSSTNLKYAAGMDRVIHNAKDSLSTEFELVLYLSAKSFYEFLKGITKILLNNPLSFSYIVFNSLSSVRSRSNPFWRFYYYYTLMFGIKHVFYWHEMPKYYADFSKSNKSDARIIEQLFKDKKSLQLSCSEANKSAGFFFDDEPNVININNCVIPRKLNRSFLLSKFTVITVASIQEIKGADIWTDVAIEVCKQNKEIHFIWCGSDVDKNQMLNECLQKVKDAGLAENISFLGKVEDAAVLTSAAHLYYCSSRLDSFPLAILEAMNHGKNIIYYDSGGVVEAVGKHGIFIENFSTDKTVLAILDKYEEFKIRPQSVFNNEVYEKFYNNYTPEIFASKLKNALFENI